MPLQYDDDALNALLPPDHLIVHPGGDRNNFLPIGKWYADMWYDMGLMDKRSHVLDIGCSVGRIAIPLTQIVGSYCGFDVVASCIDFDKSVITKAHPNFEFRYHPVRNTYYAGDNTGDPAVVPFPYPSGEFDFCYAVSVFTHMGTTEAFKHYIKEAARVLRIGGRACFTFFFSNSERPTSTIHFPDVVEENRLRVHQRGNPDVISAFDVRFVCEIAHAAGLATDEIRIGSWAEGKYEMQYQDILFLTKVQ